MLKTTAIDSPPTSEMSPMSDEQVEKYIHVVFENSPKANFGTAPANEWFMFLESFNEHKNYFIMTEQQIKSIEPYCLQNSYVEMTPNEFIMLVSMIRHEPSKQEQKPRSSSSAHVTRNMFDSRPRTSNLIPAKNTYYDDDRASTNHPDDSLNHMSESDVLGMHCNDENHNKAELLIEKLKKDRNVATRRLQEYETRITYLQDDYDDRISQLQAGLNKMRIDAEQQKILLTEQKYREKDKLTRIADLNSQNEEYEKKHALNLKQLHNKTEELVMLREEIRNLQETQTIAENQAKEMMRAHEKEKANWHMKFEEEKRHASDARHEVEAQQNENAKLIELIDKQKFDLDEARSGLRIYTNTPPTDKISLAHEQIEAEYAEKLKSIKQERDDYQQQLALTRDKLKQVQTAAACIQTSQTEKIQVLSNGFDQQLCLVESIRQRISSNEHGHVSKLYWGLSIIPWMFLFYHLLLILFYYLMEVAHMDPPQTYPFSFSQFIDELFLKYL